MKWKQISERGGAHRDGGDERKEQKKNIINALCGRRYPHYVGGSKSLKTNNSAFDIVR